MHVEGLLRRKGRDVVTVERTTPVREALQVLARHGVGALVVSSDGASVDGILSERDIVRALSERGGDLLDDPVEAIMTRDVVTCDPSTTVDQLSSLMTEGRMRHVPVLVDGRLAGIVSIGDVVKNRIRELQFERDELEHYVTG